MSASALLLQLGLLGPRIALHLIPLLAHFSDFLLNLL